MPPALGWATVADSVPAEAWILVLIIFIWTPPHFWALALGGMFVSYAWRLYRAYSDELARSMFKFSILYLALLFGALLADHWVGLLR